MSMKVATQERLRRTAVEAVGSIPGIEAVVLYGSRARGTARATSDWDIAILSHASRENEHTARGLFDELERVHPIVMNPESIEAHCNTGHPHRERRSRARDSCSRGSGSRRDAAARTWT